MKDNIVALYLVIAFLILSHIVLGGCMSFNDDTPSSEFYYPCTNGRVIAANIAQWNGSSWSAVGSGVNGTVSKIIVDSINNELYVSGEFTIAGGISVNGQAKWDTRNQAWSAIPTIPRLNTGTSVPLPMLVIGGNIYLCTRQTDTLFNPNGSQLVGVGLVRWNGIEWQMLHKFSYDYCRCGSNEPPYIVGCSENTIYIVAKRENDTIFGQYIYTYNINSLTLTDSTAEMIRNRYSYSSFGLGSMYEFYMPFASTSQGLYFDNGNGIYLYNTTGTSLFLFYKTEPSGTLLDLAANAKYIAFKRYLSNTYIDSTIPALAIYSINDRTLFSPKFTPQKTALIPLPNGNGYRKGWGYCILLDENILYIGGSYNWQLGATEFNSIAAYSPETGFWSNVGGGICGEVRSIVKLQNTLYAAGTFVAAGS